MKNFWNDNENSGHFDTSKKYRMCANSEHFNGFFEIYLFVFCRAFTRESPFIIMYVNINRYLKIYLSNPPYTYIGPRANARKKRKEKKEKFAPRSVKICETTLTFLLFFFFFGSFFCYCRNFSVILQR